MPRKPLLAWMDFAILQRYAPGKLSYVGDSFRTPFEAEHISTALVTSLRAILFAGQSVDEVVTESNRVSICLALVASGIFSIFQYPLSNSLKDMGSCELGFRVRWGRHSVLKVM